MTFVCGTEHFESKKPDIRALKVPKNKDKSSWFRTTKNKILKFIGVSTTETQPIPEVSSV